MSSSLIRSSSPLQPESLGAMPKSGFAGLGVLGTDSSNDIPLSVNPDPNCSLRESDQEANSTRPEVPTGHAYDYTDRHQARAALEDDGKSAAYYNLLSGLRERYRGVLRRRTQYVNLLSFVLFTAFYAVILLYQRRAFLGYDIHKSLTYLLPNDGEGGVLSELRSIASVHSWLDALVQDVWKDPICGNGVCDTPVEEPAYMNFGCQLDCGWKKDLQQVTVNFSYNFLSDFDRVNTLWNICRNGTCPDASWNPAISSDSCYFSNAISFSSLEGSFSTAIYPEAGSTWEFCFTTSSWSLPMSGMISYMPMTLDERSRRNVLRRGYLGDGPFETFASGSPGMGPGTVIDGSSPVPGVAPGAHNDAVGVRLAEWAYDGKLSFCQQGCLAITACIFRCAGLREMAEAQLNMSLAGVFDVSALIELCEARSGCADQPDWVDVFFSPDNMCQLSLLRWVLLGQDFEMEVMSPDGVTGVQLIKEGNHIPAPWFHGTLVDVQHLADIFASDSCSYGMGDGGSVAPPCAPGCDPLSPGNFLCEDQCRVAACQFDLTDCCEWSWGNNDFPSFFCQARTGHPRQGGGQFFRWEFTVPATDGSPLAGADNSTSEVMDVSSTEDFRWRMVGVTNRIIGGAVIKQHRTPLRPAPHGTKFWRLFDLDFNDSNWAEPFGANPRFLSKSSLYIEELVNHTHEYFTPNQLTDQGVPLAFFPLNYRGRYIFPIFIDISKSREEAMMWVEYLKAASFLDVATEEVQVEFVTYNGIIKHFGLVAISFQRQPGGAVDIKSTVEVFSLDMYNTPVERLRGAGEVLLVLMVLTGTLSELHQVVSFATGRGIYYYLANVANIIDLASISLFYICIALWIQFLVRYHGHLDLQLSYSPYRQDFDTEEEGLAKMLELANNGTDMLQLLDKFEKVRDISWVVGTYSFLAALNMLFLIFRILKLTDFHPRLGIVTHTLALAMSDIFHYLLVAGALFISFAVMGHISFGTILADFSTLPNSINTCFLMLTGDGGINDKLMQMESLQLAMGWVFFWMCAPSSEMLPGGAGRGSPARGPMLVTPEWPPSSMRSQC
eukprot:jgi/Mesvir1/29126/Mv18428-RA.3